MKESVFPFLWVLIIIIGRHAWALWNSIFIIHLLAKFYVTTRTSFLIKLLNRNWCSNFFFDKLLKRNFKKVFEIYCFVIQAFQRAELILNNKKDEFEGDKRKDNQGGLPIKVARYV